MPTTAATVTVKASRLLSTFLLLVAMAVLSGCAAASNGTPSAGQQDGSWQRWSVASSGVRLAGLGWDMVQVHVGAMHGHDPVRVIKREVAAHVAANVPARRTELRVYPRVSMSLAHRPATATALNGGPAGRLEYP